MRDDVHRLDERPRNRERQLEEILMGIRRDLMAIGERQGRTRALLFFLFVADVLLGLILWRLW